MNLGKISGRYARALYVLAEEKGLVHQVFEEMQTLANSFLKLHGLSQAMANPIFSAADKEQLLITATGGDGVSDLTRQFLHLVVEKRREEFILFMAMSFQDIYRKEQHIMLGKVTSVKPLPQEALERLNQLIAQRYNSQLLLSTATDADLIGGFVLEVGNYRFDASVRTELRQIKEKLTAL